KLSPAVVQVLPFKSLPEQSVQVINCFGTAQSDFVEVSMGAPQGSILGPLLFALYVNDLSSCVPEARVTQMLMILR
ncbi:hypothetical protein J6590_107579, partial [Homalodisca vitripennis]